MKTKPKTTRPKPPDDLADEGLLEWDRITADLETAGRLDVTDRALLVQYVQTWQQNQAVTRMVLKHGAVIRHPNNAIGTSAFYDVQNQTAKLIVRLLKEMGLTPASRGSRTARDADEDDDLPPY